MKIYKKGFWLSLFFLFFLHALILSTSFFELFAKLFLILSSIIRKHTQKPIAGMTSKLNFLAAMTTTTAPTDDEYQRQRLDSCIQIEEMEDVVYSLQEDTKRRPITISKSNGNLLAQPLSKLTSNKMQSVRDKTSQMNENVDYMDADFADDNVSNDALTFDRHLRHSTTSTFHPNRAFTMAVHQKD